MGERVAYGDLRPGLRDELAWWTGRDDWHDGDNVRPWLEAIEQTIQQARLVLEELGIDDLAGLWQQAYYHLGRGQLRGGSSVEVVRLAALAGHLPRGRGWYVRYHCGHLLERGGGGRAARDGVRRALASADGGTEGGLERALVERARDWRARWRVTAAACAHVYQWQSTERLAFRWDATTPALGEVVALTRGGFEVDNAGFVRRKSPHDSGLLPTDPERSPSEKSPRLLRLLHQGEGRGRAAKVGDAELVQAAESEALRPHRVSDRQSKAARTRMGEPEPLVYPRSFLREVRRRTGLSTAYIGTRLRGLGWYPRHRFRR